MKTKKQKPKPIKGEYRDAPMPRRFDGDHAIVTALIRESERNNALGNGWLSAPIPNAIAADMALRHGWAYALSAAWLRCVLRGDLEVP